MSGRALSTDMDIYHMQGEVVINMVEMMDPMVHFREMMSRYAKLKRKPIMLSGE